MVCICAVYDAISIVLQVCEGSVRYIFIILQKVEYDKQEQLGVPERLAGVCTPTTMSM